MFRLLFDRSPVQVRADAVEPDPARDDPENEVWLNADMAARMGLTDVYVRLRNQDARREATG